MNQKMNDDLPVYRLLTGPDGAGFCRRVSEVLNKDYQRYGSPRSLMTRRRKQSLQHRQ
ncbi:DUF1737 domain-containing protein [Tatumella sp. UBA2305]|uniref:DUF1737 domain-containing protein n=1 Tax=Tatumella sp. UBA2305 TaxID=1947647 RepID=UPI0032E37672